MQLPPLPASALRVALFALLFVAASRIDALEAPPHHPDLVRLTNGCQLSTMLYLRRFADEFPGERGTSVIVDNPAGRMRHTVAIVTWRGEWWCRDDRMGVIPLGLKAGDAGLPSRIEKTVGRLLAGRAKEHYKGVDLKRLVAENANPTAERRAIDVVAAAGLVSGSTIYWIGERGREVPVLFFRPSPGWIGVYDPANGSAVAEVDSTNDVGVVRTVAKRLGYAATSVRTAEQHAPVESAAVVR